MALLLKKHVFIFTCVFLLYHWAEPGQNMKTHKMIYELNMYESYFDLLIGNRTCLLASVKIATYSLSIVSLSLMKDNNISSDGCTETQLSGQCFERAQCTRLLVKYKFKLNLGSI